MSVLDKIKSVCDKPQLLLLRLSENKVVHIPDKIYLKLMYKAIMGEKLDLNNPKTFNEKLQWLKLNNRNELYTKLVDKYSVKEYITSVLGADYVIPTLGVWDKFEDIDFNKLPDKFVLKCTHDSGGVVICKGKENFDFNNAKAKLENSLKKNFYYSGREWPYKNVKPRIIAEKFMEDLSLREMRDYKFYCFNGRVDYCMICLGRASGNTKFYYVTRDGQVDKRMSFDGMNLGENESVQVPSNIKEMFNIAESLTKELPFVRLDLYNVNGQIYFGEYTFYPSSGFDNDRSEFAKEYLNNMLKIKGDNK